MGLWSTWELFSLFYSHHLDKFPNQNFKQSSVTELQVCISISTSLIPGVCSADKGLASALMTAILRAGPCTTALAVCLKQICHVTQIK